MHVSLFAKMSPINRFTVRDSIEIFTIVISQILSFRDVLFTLTQTRLDRIMAYVVLYSGIDEFIFDINNHHKTESCKLCILTKFEKQTIVEVIVAQT